ncbi:MAG: Ribulose-phosphate 3-epimerase [Parcubacteria group bacterium GW2011_GWB1_56_8]|nr:MAG: Ribulose-phosphate 3-epimerase [Parcubacteria group bacterium GW2011_GWB1_56_8]
MVTVIPAINCPDRDLECVREKVRVAESLFSDLPRGVIREEGWVHLDVTDARFTFNKTWGNARDWRELDTALNLEVHLMVEEPEKIIEDWLRAGARRVIVHFESFHGGALRHHKTAPQDIFRVLLEACAAHRAELMLALNPETPPENALTYCGAVKAIQVLAVHPGLAEQKFMPFVLEKIKFLRRQFPDATIEVDGGVDAEIGKRAVKAGANVLVSASYIFESEEPTRAYQELKRI